MADNDERTDEGRQSAPRLTDRRTFVKGATMAGAGLVGTVGLADAEEPLGRQTQVQDPEMPPALGPNAQLDSRFPVTYKNSVPEATRVITSYFAALSRRDRLGMADCLHFPFGSFEGVEPVVVNTPDEFMAHPPASMNLSEDPVRFTDNDGFLKPGCYDVFDGLEILASDPEHVGVALVYDRYDENGKRLLRCQGIYAVNNNDGKWGIELMSTIFTPDNLVGVEFPRTAEAAIMTRVIHNNFAYNHADYSEHALCNQIGTRLSASGGSWSAGPRGGTEAVHKIRGVVSRLRVGETTEEDIAQYGDPERIEAQKQNFREYRELWRSSGVGEWGWVSGLHPGVRVIHQDFHKAHLLAGAIRFTAAGDIINVNRGVRIVTYRKGRWGGAGTVAYTCDHDRSNDLRPGSMKAPQGIG